MDAELKNLQIDRTRRRSARPSQWVKRSIAAVVVILLLLIGWWFAAEKFNPAPIVEVQRLKSMSAGSAPQGVILNATGYIVAAHKIEVAAKVIGRVKWIGVDKGDRVKEGEVIVRLEDDEYQAQLTQAKGQLASLQANLDRALNGSRPEEIAQALANVRTAQSDLDNARITLDRNQRLLKDGVVAQQVIDDAQARYDNALHRVDSLQKSLDLLKLGPRKEDIDSLRGQVEQARGALNYAETNLANTIIRAPVTGTILERAVEKGEFVTTSFVGDRGAKGYVVSLADLNDLEVELDIAQNDFAKLHAQQHGAVTTDAFPDRKYDGFIKEISPEANRQKATVQIKVKISQPDGYLRPEMNASVAFAAEEKAVEKAAKKAAKKAANPAKPGSVEDSAARPVVMVPAAALRDGSVFVLLDGRALRRAVKTGATSTQGVRVEQGLVGGEDLILNPPPGLKDGDKVRRKAASL